MFIKTILRLLLLILHDWCHVKKELTHCTNSEDSVMYGLIVLIWGGKLSVLCHKFCFTAT